MINQKQIWTSPAIYMTICLKGIEEVLFFNLYKRVKIETGYFNISLLACNGSPKII